MPSLAARTTRAAVAATLGLSLTTAGSTPPAAAAALVVPLISGVPAEGGALTAIPGRYDGEPESFDFQWYAAGRPVGIDSPVYRPTAADLGASISVRVTARVAGQPDVITSSAPSGTVAPGGAVVGWGESGGGRTTVPASLAGRTVTAVAAGTGESLAVTADGAVTGWGDDDYGQTSVPAVLTGRTVTAVSTGGDHSLALAADGTVTGWGLDDDGQASVPAALTGNTVVALDAGDRHSLALTADGTVTGWGLDDDGQATIPASLDGRTVVAVAAGGSHSLALTADGTVTGWGLDDDGQATVPASLDDTTVIAIAAGWRHSLALTADGTVVGWGRNASGQATPPSSPTGRTALWVGAGDSHSLALTADRAIIGWGYNGDDRATAPPSLTGMAVTAVDAGSEHALALVPRVRLAPVVTGAPQVGRVLTADTSASVPAPQSVIYTWYADGVALPSATGPTYTPTAAQLGARISVQISATAPGYLDATTTSGAVGPVTAAPTPEVAAPPTVDLRTSRTTVRRGKTFTLSWTSTGDASLAASGNWRRPRSASGSLRVEPRWVGYRTYRLTAANTAGTATDRVRVEAFRPATRLRVALRGPARAGTKVKVSVRGLAVRERFTIRLGRITLVTGTTKRAVLAKRVTLPRGTRAGRHTLTVTGYKADRVGQVRIEIPGPGPRR